MSQHTITSVIEGDLFSVLLFLEGESINLSYNGSDTYRSTNTIEINGALNVAFQARGVAFAQWAITITADGNEVLKESGMIGAGGQSVLVTAVSVPETDDAGQAATKKGGAKKGAAKKGAAKKGGQ